MAFLSVISNCSGVVTMNEKEFREKVYKLNKENFKLAGFWEHYILGIKVMPIEDVYYAALHEANSNGQMLQIKQFVKRMFVQMKKNKNVDDWKKYAEWFTKGYDEEGNKLP